MKQKIALLQVHLRKIGRFHKKEREMVAYHEAGHTIVGLVLSNARVVHKVTIVPWSLQAVT